MVRSLADRTCQPRIELLRDRRDAEGDHADTVEAREGAHEATKRRLGRDVSVANRRHGHGGQPEAPELKGSIGEGPNHSNHSNHSNSFKIGIFRNFPSKIQKFQKFSICSKLSAKLR